MNYNALTKPCAECPFLQSMAHGFTFRRLMEFSEGEFACHKACKVDEEAGDFVAKSDKTPHCAGALIFREKLNLPNQMMRICERLRMYDRTKLDMAAPVQPTARKPRRGAGKK